jgi:DNA-binding NtrC family response regulator
VKARRNEPLILIVSSCQEERKKLWGAMPEGLQIREVPPGELEESALLVDAQAAVAVLDGARGDEAVEELQALASLQAGRSLILAHRDTSDALLELAISRLGPAEVVAYPPPAPLLGMLIRRSLPHPDRGQSVLPGRRSAVALQGVSQSIHQVSEQIRQVARSRMPVLVLGETGTGKELVARAIHQQSDRATGPFVAVNCSALPDTLLESELFGFERGAFSGAVKSKRGLFEQASGGTFFLDEIGDMPPAMQVKLLRVLETQEIRRLGGNETRNVDVRILSATHRDLEAAIETDAFRQDLLFRLNTATIYIPPLRRRRVDIPFLAQHFAEQFGEEHARSITLADDFLETLERRDFPGNVRELRNAVERAIALAQPGEDLSRRHLETGARESPLPQETPTGTLKAAVERLECDMIRDALRRFEGNRTRTATALGLSRLGLRQKMKRLGIEAAPGR